MNIYDILNKIIKNSRFELSANLFVENDRELLDDNEKTLFDLLKNISSLGTEIHNNEIKFHPLFVTVDGKCTFTLDDMSEEDYKRLGNLEFDKIPLTLRALIADILWTNKKDFNASKVAVDAYWELFVLWYKDDDNVGTLDMIRRAVCISAQTKQTTNYEKIQKWFNFFVENGVASGNVFFAIRVMELFFEQKNFDVSVLLPALDKIIFFNQEDVVKIEQAYKLKTKCLFKLKRKDEAIKSNILLADYYLNHAEQILNKDIKGALIAENFYQKGIMLYRNNGETGKAEIAHKRLVEIQKEIPKTMVSFSVKLDIKGVIDNIKVNMEGLDFEECVIRLTQMFVFEKQEEIKKKCHRRV